MDCFKRFGSKRLYFVLALSAWQTPSLLTAQQLSQPASILPWQATQPEVNQPERYLALNGPIKSSISDSPAWLLDTAKPLSRQSPTAKTMPMVETESFANLGQLSRNSTAHHAKSAQRKHASHAGGNGAFNLFRALGIKANRSGRHR